MAKKTIEIGYHRYAATNDECFVVQKVVDSVQYLPNQSLTKADVQRLCDSSIWTVVIKPMKVA